MYRYDVILMVGDDPTNKQLSVIHDCEMIDYSNSCTSFKSMIKVITAKSGQMKYLVVTNIPNGRLNQVNGIDIHLFFQQL